MSLTFSAWIKSRRAGEDARGAFIRDVRRDRCFPNDPHSWDEISLYLDRYETSHTMRCVAEQLWEEYQRVTRVNAPLYQYEW